MDEQFSERAIKDYCFDYDDDTNEIQGNCYRNNNPKKLVEGINLEELLGGKDVVFEVSKGYDESLLQMEDPDVFNEVAYSKSSDLQQRRGAPPPDCSFESLAKEMEDVVDGGFVKKQIITHGIGVIVPENSYVTVEYNLYKEGDSVPFDSTYLRRCPQKFRLDLVETILGLNHAVKSMKKSENSRFFISWEYAFGALGCPDRIEPKCNIIADITLVDYVEVIPESDQCDLNHPENFKHNFQASLNEAKTNHLNGTDNFQKGDVSKAITCYRKSLRILNDMMLSNEAEERAMVKQKVKCLVNLAVCYNKIGKYEQACLACQDVLSLDHENVKAFYQYGKASLALSNFSGARKWLLKAAKFRPHDPDINAELKKLNDKKVYHETMTKKFWEKAFQKATISQSTEEK